MSETILIAQLAVIVAAAQIVGRIFRAIGQPTVIGEMLAGILLGPSLLGWIAPGVSSALFPADSIPLLGALSQVGLVLFLFVIGLQHDPATLHGQGRTAVAISIASLAVPFALGAVLAFALHAPLSEGAAGVTELALFLGTAMSITAFPVLARIVIDRGLLGTTVGALALVCAAVNDVVGWLLMGGVLLVVGAGGGSPWLAVVGTVVYAVFMLTAGRRGLGLLLRAFHARHAVTLHLFALVLLIVLVSAAITEWLGVHPLFGAFLAGVAMPKDPAFVRELARRLEDVTVVLLLPTFFVVSGLRTHVGVLDRAEMWLYFAAVLAVAVAGKIGGTAIAARVTGKTWREATALGVLVNTRGLVELVLLNIGYEAGIIAAPLFTMLVLMAIATTFMAGSLFDLVYSPRRREAAAS